MNPQEGEEKARENIESLNAEIQTMTKTIEEYIAGAEDISLMEARKAKEELVMQVQNLKEDVKRLRREAEEHSQQIDKLSGRGDELEEKNSKLGNELQAWLPDGYNQIFRLYVFGPSGFWTMAPLRCKI